MSIPPILIDQESLPTTYDIEAYAGCDYCLPLHLQADVSGTVTDVNLTGVTYALKVSTKRAGTALVSAAVTETDATTGVYVTGLTTGGAAGVHVTVPYTWW